MSVTSLVPISSPPEWRELKRLAPHAQGFFRVAFRGSDPMPPCVEVAIGSVKEVRFEREVDGVARVRLVARNETELVAIIGVVDRETAELLRKLWLWRAGKMLEAAERARRFLSQIEHLFGSHPES